MNAHVRKVAYHPWGTYHSSVECYEALETKGGDEWHSSVKVDPREDYQNVSFDRPLWLLEVWAIAG